MFYWKLIVAYDGTPYHGWQVQPGLPTVQGVLAEVISRLTGETVLPQGSGRTDTGVHAMGQVVSFDLETAIPGPNLQRALNHLLPSSIRVRTITSVPPEFHARHSTRRKTYEYRICTDPVCLPVLAPFVWNCTWPLLLEPMQEAATLVTGTHDFTSFAATDPDLADRSRGDLDGSPNCETSPRSKIRRIDTSTWERRAESGSDLLIYRVTGSGFLHHMVRNLVGTFVDVGRGRTMSDDIPSIIAARSRSASGPTAPPQGLFLMHVEYDD